MLNENVLNENAWKMEVIQYIAGFLVKKLKNVINCSYCSELLESKFNHSEHDLSLISKKNRGGLLYPSQDLFRLCKITENFIYSLMQTKHIWMANIFSVIAVKVLHYVIEYEKNLFKSCNHDPEHFYKHVKLIVISYSSVRLKYIAKVENQNLKTGQRTKLSKQILFANQ